MTIEERLAELENKFAAMSVAQQAAGDPSGYYTSIYSGEQIDAAIGNVLNVGNNPIAIKNIGAAPRRNLLDNWYFVGGGSQQGGGQFPINQRGQTSYNTAGYNIDRWINTGGTVSLTGDGIGLSSGSINRELYQSLESTDVKGKTCTISALLSTGLVQGTFVFPTVIGSAVTAFDDHEKFALIARVMDTGLPACSLWTYGGKTNTVLAAKLELGTTQTLAYQDEDGNWQLFETPDYGEELAKCQRYQLALGNAMRIRASRVTNTSIYFFVPIPSTIRNTPSIINPSSLQVYELGGSVQTGFSFDCPPGAASTGNGIAIVATKTNHGMQDGFLYVDASINPGATLLDANL